MWPLLASVVTACVVVVVRNLVVHAFLKKKDDGGSDVNNNETDFENNAAAVAEGAPMRVAEGMTLLVKRQDDTLRDLEAEMQHTKFEFQTALRRTAPDQSQFTSLEEFKDINQENQMLAPHLLRRVKKDVMKKLPPRKELISFVELSRKQKEHYKEPLICNYQLLTPRGDSQMHVINGVMELAKLYCHSFILEGVEPEYTNNYQLVTRRGGAQIPLINVVMELAKLCCYPFMLEGVELEDTNEFYKQLLDTLAGKLQLLDKTIVKPREQGHRVLIYTQLQHMLDYYFNCRIDGKVSGGKRQVGINRVKSSSSDQLFSLSSTRAAGGLGINPATTGMVINHDSHCNPLADLQAMTLDHSLGQKNKVGDLGLSKVKHQTLTLGGVLGTRLCMANELLNGSGSSSHVSEKVDLFSFGTVIWELLAGVIIRNTLRPLVPESCDLKWRSLMERCWSADPSERPSFTDVANQLRTITSKVPPKVTRGTTEEGIMEMTKKKMVLPPSPLPPSTPSPLPPTTSSSIRYSPHPPSPQPSSTTTTSIHHSPHPLKSTAGSRLRLYPQMKPIKREIQAPCTPKFQPSVTSSIRYSTNPPSPPSPPPPTTTTTSVLHSPHSPKSSATLRLRHYPRMKPIEREVQAPCIIIRGFNDIYKNRAPCTSNIQPSTTSSIWQSPHPPKSSATFRLLDKSRTDKKIGFKSRTDRIRIV